MNNRLAVVFLAAAGCAHCGDERAPTDASTTDATKTDGGDDADAEAWDGAVISDWPGWRRLTELDPSCGLDVPIDPKTVLPIVKWIACTDGRPQCLQLDTSSWKSGASTIFFGVGRMSEGLSHIIVSRPADDPVTTFETDIIDVSTWTAIAGFRMTGTTFCTLNIAMSKAWTSILGMIIGQPTPFVVDRRAIAQTGSTSFNFVATDVTPWKTFQSQSQQIWASDLTLAFDLAPARVVGRVEGSSSHIGVTQSPPLTYPIVVGADVYAVDQSGTDGWPRLMRVNADGSTLQYRAVASHHIATPASDGTTMYWTECYGTGNPGDNAQPNVELWSAPYTNDPTMLGATAAKVANLGTNCVYETQQLAQNGLFFAVSGTSNFVYRKSDGKVLTFTNGPNRGTWYPLYISQTEYWSIEGASNGPKGVALTRLQLASW